MSTDKLHLQKLYIQQLYPSSELSIDLIGGKVKITGTLSQSDIKRNACLTAPLIDLPVVLLQGEADDWDREYEYYIDQMTAKAVPSSTILGYEEWMDMCELLQQQLRLREIYCTLQHHKGGDR